MIYFGTNRKIFAQNPNSNHDRQEWYRHKKVEVPAWVLGENIHIHSKETLNTGQQNSNQSHEDSPTVMNISGKNMN